MFLYVCKQTFRIFQKKTRVIMRNLCDTIFCMRTNVLQDFHICISVPLRGEKIKQKSLQEHFLCNGHQSFEMLESVWLIKLALHKREYYWMRTLKTIAPFGLNTKETYWDEYWEVHTIMRFSPLVLLVYITAERM